jgi:2-polyprenyl-6-methoxyphenol hydroxylase-like FAD-dependent oxidoreductase
VRDRPILIVGGGFAGLSAAILLRRANIPFRIFEATGGPSDMGGAITMFPNGMKVLRECGVREQVVDKGALMTRVILRDHFGKAFANVSMGVEELYAEPTFTIRRSLLHEFLIDRAESLGAEIEYGKKLVGVSQEPDRLTAEFEDGSRAEGTILIGADGINSTVRRFVVPESDGPAYTGLIFFAGFVEDQEFIAKLQLLRDHQYLTVGPVGFFGYSYVDNPERAEPSVLWYCYLAQEDRMTSAELKALGDPEIKLRVMDAHQGWHWPIRDLVERSATLRTANVFDVIGLSRWSRGRAIIIGDAAHATNPIAGQGANTALEDSQLLVELLACQAGPVEDVFRHFEDVRKPRVTQIAAKARVSSRRSMIKVGRVGGWVRNQAYGIMTRVIPESWSNRRLRYEVAHDKEEILRRLAPGSQA